VRITIYTQATARHSLCVDAQLLQAALYRLAGDQNVARHKRAHTCIASHRREQASPMSWDVLSQATNGYREAPVCELPMNTSRYMVSQVQAHRVYLLFFRDPCAASRVCSTLTHFYMPLSNHKYKQPGAHAAYCSPSVPHPRLSRDAEQMYSRDLGELICARRALQCHPSDSAQI
jgi:hypothetical protein